MAKSKNENPKKQKVRFLKSPTGRFNLGYSIGDVATFDINQAQELIETKFAEPVK